MNEFMSLAYNEAQKAFSQNEVPIGCIIVKDGEVVANTYNMRQQLHSISAHAEILCMDKAGEKLGRWILDDCEMYVTVEPCLMCYGAIKQSRIKKVYVGCLQDVTKNHTYRKHFKDTIIDETYVNEKCSEIMKNFFKKKRIGE